MDASDADERAFILVCAYRRQQAIAAAAPPDPWRWWEVAERAEQLARGPRYQPSKWFGPLTPDRIRKRCRRAIDRLEAADLLTTWRKYSGRLTHLKLTAEGESLALQLIARHEPNAPEVAANNDVQVIDALTADASYPPRPAPAIKELAN